MTIMNEREDIESSTTPTSDKDEAKQENAEDDMKSEVDDEIGEGQEEEEGQLSETVYQIRPRLHEKFKPSSVKEIIHNLLFDELSTKTYNAEDASKWCKDIANMIKVKVKELKFKRYKYMVNVVLGEQKGAGVKMGTRCIWDAEADSYAYDSFVNDTIFCAVSVYAVYHY